MTARWLCVMTAVAALLLPHWLDGGGVDPAGFVIGLLGALALLVVRAAFLTRQEGTLPGHAAEADN
jgi:hypothetical protein